MGNGSSSAINIVLNKQIFVEGDRVQGYVQINALEPMVVNSIEIHFKGTEKLYVRTKETTSSEGSDGQRHTETEYCHDHQRHEIFCWKVPLFQGQGTPIVPGVYSFPFDLVLPAELPGSTKASGYQGDTFYQASIKYKVKAVCNVGGWFKKSPKITRELTVVERPDVLPPATVSQYHPVTKFCCFNRGQVGLELAVPHSLSYPCNGGAVQTVARVDNTNDKARIDHVSLSIYQVTRLSCRSRNGGRPVEFERKLENVRLPEIKAGMALDRTQIALAIEAHEPSIRGQLFQRTYYLDLHPAITMAHASRLRMPVSFYMPIPENMMMAQANEMAIINAAQQQMQQLQQMEMGAMQGVQVNGVNMLHGVQQQAAPVANISTGARTQMQNEVAMMRSTMPETFPEAQVLHVDAATLPRFAAEPLPPVQEPVKA